MDALKPIPITVLGPPDEANAGMIMPMLPDTKTNFAEDTSVQAYLLEHVLPIIPQVRTHRVQLEEEWREERRMALLQHDSNQSYIGRSNAYVPAYLRAENTLVSKLARGLFPSDQYLDVTEESQGAEDAAQATKQYLQYEFDKCMKLRGQLKPYIRQFVRHGWSVGKHSYHKEMKKKLKGKKGISMNDVLATMEKDTSMEGSRFKTVSIFNFYVWPTTVDSLEEATLVFEDVDVPMWFIKEMFDKGRWPEKLRDAALNAPTDPNHLFNQQMQQADMVSNTITPTSGTPATGDIAAWKMLTEAWVSIPLPKEAYAQGEEVGSPVLCKIILAKDVAVEVSRQPYWHGKLPYVDVRSMPEPGSYYCKGHGFIARYLQYLVNDFANQTNDNGTYALNPVALMNPNTLAATPAPLKPGAVLLTTDPANGIKFDRPPVEQIQYGQQLLQSWVSMLHDNVGTPPIMQGTNAGKGARTATSSQILQANAENPIQDIVEDFEQAVMQPLMYMTHSNGLQFREGKFWVQIAGLPPLQLSPQDIVGDFQFIWCASSQAASKQQQAQQAMQLLQLATNPAILQLLQMKGLTIDPSVLLRKVYAEGFGFRGFEQFVVPAPMMGAPGMPGQPPGAPMPPGAHNAGMGANQQPGALEPQQGEGEQFADVRDNADSLAAMFGGLGVGS